MPSPPAPLRLPAVVVNVAPVPEDADDDADSNASDSPLTGLDPRVLNIAEIATSNDEKGRAYYFAPGTFRFLDEKDAQATCLFFNHLLWLSYLNENAKQLQGRDPDVPIEAHLNYLVSNNLIVCGCFLESASRDDGYSTNYKVTFS